MRVLLTLCLVVCATVGVKYNCSSVCTDFCNNFLEMCSQKSPTADIPCESLAEQCTSACNNIYCSCLENITKTCLPLRDDCTDSGMDCLLTIFTCLASEIPSCAYTVSNIITSLANKTMSEILTFIPNAAGLYSNGGISLLTNWLVNSLETH